MCGGTLHERVGACAYLVHKRLDGAEDLQRHALRQMRFQQLRQQREETQCEVGGARRRHRTAQQLVADLDDDGTGLHRHAALLCPFFEVCG